MLTTRLASVALVSVLILGMTGGAAASPSQSTVPDQEQRTQTVQYDGRLTQDQDDEPPELVVSDVEIENLSTTMTIESATMTIEQDGRTRNVTVDSAEVQLESADVIVQNATLDGDELDLLFANVTVTEGTVSVQSSAGDRTIDLSDTDVTVENRTVSLTDVVGAQLGVEDLEGATVTEMQVEGISVDGSVETALTNFQTFPPLLDGPLFYSATTGDANYSADVASMTVQDATVEDGMLVAGEVTVEVDSAEFRAGQVTALRAGRLVIRRDVQRTVSDETFTATDVQVAPENADALFLALMAALSPQDGAGDGGMGGNESDGGSAA